MAALTRVQTAQQVTLLPDPALPSLSRPLAVVGDHTYAAIWPFVNRGQSTQPVARELILVRDDGQLLDAPFAPVPGRPAPDLDWFLPSHPPLPADRLLSGDGVQRYRDGHRPDPAVVFANLVTVLNQFVDFTGSLGPPDLMAEFFAAYLLTTWFAPAFPFHGLLWLLGDNGAGKSRLLALLARLAHLGLYLPVLPPALALRALASLGAVLAVDDADFLGPRGHGGQWSLAARSALLLAGRQRGALLPVTLAQPGQSTSARHTRLLDVSGPRLFASLHPPHLAIARYFIVIPLVRTADAPLAAADPADPTAWPPGLTLTNLVDDLWALALSRLRALPPHLSLAAQAAAASPLPLLGASLQPWHALLATASWLSSSGVPGLLDRLLGLAHAYHATRPVAQNADLTVLCLRALFARISAVYQRREDLADAAALAAYDRAHGIAPGDDLNDDTNDMNDANDANDTNDTNDANDANTQDAVHRIEQRQARDDWLRAYYANPDRVRPPFPSSFALMSVEVLNAMRDLAAVSDPDLLLDHLTPPQVGRLLRQLCLKPHHTTGSRHWIITPAALARLARAYSVPVPPDLVQHFPPAQPFPNGTSP